MSPEESELIGRIIQNNQNNSEQLVRALEGQKLLFQQLARMEQERNYWKDKAEKAQAEVITLMMKQNRPIDKN